MSAEQHHSSLVKEFLGRFRRPVIRGLDAHPLFARYFEHVNQGMHRNEALRAFRNELEINLRSYTQEGIGDRDIAEYGTKVAIRGTKLEFIDHRGLNTIASQRLHNQEVYKDQPQVIAYFETELQSWERVWTNAITPFVELINEPDPQKIQSQLQRAGFRPIETQLTSALKALLPELAHETSVLVYEHPQKYMLASPRHPLHHHGETSIARLIRLVYIPASHTFAFFERGLFTAYTNEQIAQFFTVDGKAPPHFTSPEAMLSHVAYLTQEFGTMAPHAVFNHIINQLGTFPEIPVGDNVIRETPRTFTSQITFVEQILTFEEQRIHNHPELAATLSERLERMLEPIEHSLLRANELDVNSQVHNYIHIFSDPYTALHPNQAKRAFRLGVLTSYPDFATRVSSVLDCSSGTILGGLQKAGDLGGIESIIGLDAYRALQSLEGKSIANRSEFALLARKLGKDPESFKNWGVCTCPDCGSKGLKNWLGPCGWCLGCEIKDDLGLHGILPETGIDQSTFSKQYSQRTTSPSPYKRYVGIGDVISSTTIGQKAFL